MTTRRRLDLELARRHLARSREEAQAFIDKGVVKLNGVIADKPARLVSEHDSLVLTETGPRWVSRGAHKLLGAIDAFTPQGLNVAGRRCLDAGASTGGFTQVLLSHDASHVIAVDVGYGQLDWSLRTDSRVEVRDKCNIRHLRLLDIGDPVDLVVADLSFISLQLVVPVLASLTQSQGDLLLMVKPQFEAGRDAVGAGGVVRNPAVRAAAVRAVRDAAAAVDWRAAGVVASPLPGPSGNVEFFLWLRKDSEAVTDAMIDRVVNQGVE